MNTAAGTTTYARIVNGAAFQVGDRVQVILPYHHNLFGTVLDVRACEHAWLLDSFRYRLKLDDPVRGASLEGAWLDERYLERMGDLEQLAFSTGL